MAEYTERQQRYLDCIAPIEGITFVGFEPVEARAAYDNATRSIALISKQEHTEDEIGDWVVRTLKRERIMGEFFLNFQLDVHRLPYGRVRLTSPWF